MQSEILVNIFLVFGLGCGVMCKDISWDFFVLSQQWTPSLCESEQNEHKCIIPESVRGWTVHGLWPNKKGSEDPNFCNETLKFDWDKIESLKTNLTAQWPNVFVDTSPTDFWKHEWDKHGTCAVTLPATGDEYKYFSTALALNVKFNLTETLLKFDVVPSYTVGYQTGRLIELLKKEFPGTTPQFQCVFVKEKKQQLLLQVELCLDKEFHFTVCDNPPVGVLGEDCNNNEPVYIWPLHNTTRHAQSSKLSEYFEISYSEYSVIRN